MELGEELGRGVRSVVYEWGDRDVVKVADRSTPDSWLTHELWLMDAAARAGARVPGRRRLVEVAGRPAIAMERVVGRSMWELLVAEPCRAADLGRRLADAQAELATCRPSYEMPLQRSRLVSKIHTAADRYGDDLLRVLDHMPIDDGPLTLCHGDLHPRNVLLAPEGLVLVDWYDASRGDIGADIARTTLMLELSGEHGTRQAPDAAIMALRHHYLSAACELAGLQPIDIERWHLVQEIARLAEGINDDRVTGLRERVATFGGDWSTGPMHGAVADELAGITTAGTAPTAAW